MHRITVLIAVLACCECATLRDEVSPIVKTDLDLTAHNSEVGNWTADLGDMQVKIEHTHGDTSPKEDGFWMLDIARTSYEKEEENKDSDNIDLAKENSEKITANPEISQEETKENMEDDTNTSEATNENTDMDNEIPVDESFKLKDEAADLDQPLNKLFSLRQYETHSHVEPYAYETDSNYDSDEALFDTDNFEYFKGVGWFKLDDRYLDWSHARYACAEVGAHLAVPDTPDRVKVLQELFEWYSDTQAYGILPQQVYIGVSDRDDKGLFTTVQGKVYAQTLPAWYHYEPEYAPVEKQCATFNIEGRKQTVPCFYRLPFFCEKNIPA